MRQAKTVKEVLIAARWIIKHIGWCQGTFARKPDGTALWGAVGESPLTDGNCFCPIGAIRVVEADVFLRSQAIEVMSEVPSLELGSIAIFNDTSERTKREVLRLFDQAIARAT